MRAFLVFTILLLGLSGAAPEPEYSLRGDGVRAGRDVLGSLVEIESSTRRGDRLSLAALGPRALRVEVLKQEDRDLRLRLGSLDSDIDAVSTQPQSEPPTASSQTASLVDLCHALLASAQDNNLPVPFFANLLWQESRFRVDDVSKKGAQGIAQFMPKVAIETGLVNPFDPMQAIPASARFLQRLRLQFGNLGFVAAAYNAGAHRVIEWLERRASVPRETRDYVVRVTGLSVETWKTMPIDNDALTFVPRLPCRNLPAFANVEQERIQQTEAERAKHAPIQEPLIAKTEKETAAAGTSKLRETRRPSQEQEMSKHAAKREAKREPMRVARDNHASKHEATHTPHARERHRSA
jgi:hypothetical protein